MQGVYIMGLSANHMWVSTTCAAGASKQFDSEFGPLTKSQAGLVSYLEPWKNIT